MEKICLQCQKGFETKRPKSKFCSISCSATYSGSRRILPEGRRFPNQRKLLYKPCLWCEKETSHKFFCCISCRLSYNAKQQIKKFIQGTLKFRREIFKFIIERDGNICAICNMEGIWQNKPLRLVLDHIDGDATNDKPNNFRLLCPNCDSQTDTYKARNYGKGRKSRGLPSFS